MKAQTSLEFILILAAVIGIAVAALGMMHNLQLSESAATGRIANQTEPGNASNTYVQPSGSPFIYAEISNITYVNGSNEGYLVAYMPQGYSLRNINISGINASVIWQPGNSYPATGIYASDYFAVPKSVGRISVLVSAEFNGPYGLDQKEAVAYAYAEVEQSGSVIGAGTAPANGIYLTPQLSARNETLLYDPAGIAPVYTVSMTSHCSYENWEYQQLGIADQCGNAQWYFWIFSDYCYWDKGITTATYCVYMDNTSASAGTFNSVPAYSYNTTLQLYNNTYGIHMSAMLNSRSADSPVLEGNATYGNASAGTQISAESPLPEGSVFLIKSRNGSYIAGSGGYQSYLQALNSLDSVLGYYNGSGIDSGSMETIQQTIGSYNTAAARLLNSTLEQVGGCRFDNLSDYLDCSPAGPFDYLNMTAVLSNSINARQGVEYFSGSAIGITTR